LENSHVKKVVFLTYITPTHDADPDVNHYDHRQLCFEAAAHFANKAELSGIAASAQSVVREGGKVSAMMKEKSLSLFTYNIAK
jgi:hypothetical protein